VDEFVDVVDGVLEEAWYSQRLLVNNQINHFDAFYINTKDLCARLTGGTVIASFIIAIIGIVVI
jgi:hypothetical protein